ncbi:AAA family ATPase [Dinghuibacter silviterrae]|uniref:Putative ATPase n=1 Tax=Dinghuibacter silviterrae TaxID=1539049 RepID=A0A4R8DJ85_9BACT|nr:AAA family ATPase [Dinghuibacter silviterrae]TDW97627.1 putative ATPase [Dinghuibacter silviterrae]
MPFIKSFSINADKRTPFPFNIPAVQFAREVVLDERVTIFVGDNGSGKSTLLESIAFAVHLPLIGGQMSAAAGSFEAARLLKPYLELVWARQTSKGFFFRAEDFSDFIDGVEKGRMKIEMDLADLKGQVDDAIIRQMSDSMNYALHNTRRLYGADLQAFSHGEAYLTILQNRIQDKGVYLLDEPEAALSPLKQLALIAFILEVLKNNNTQFIIATHSPILMGIPGARLYEIREEEMRQVAYTETDHYRVTKRFLDNPESYLRHF